MITADDFPVIVDAGPLVAFLNRRDTHHSWAVEALGRVRPPLLTCESVISEACFLLRRDAKGADGVLELVARDLLQVAFDLAQELDDVRRLMKRYADVPMSLADACLVRMSERYTKASVLTLDGDFRHYRRRGRQVIPLIAPRPER
jgi:predicted nucleic acid-binding protein